MKMIFQPEKKGWLKSLGLHHAALAFILIGAGHLVALGYEAAIFALAWYGAREYKELEHRRYTAFEIMDFVSPLIVAVSYIIWL